MPSSGTLLTRVFTSRGQLPVEDTAVSIVQHGADGQQHLVNIQTSDQSGNTQPTVLETPDVENSLSPASPSPLPCVTSGLSGRAISSCSFRMSRFSPGWSASRTCP